MQGGEVGCRVMGGDGRWAQRGDVPGTGSAGCSKGRVWSVRCNGAGSGGFRVQWGRVWGFRVQWGRIWGAAGAIGKDLGCGVQ